MTRESMVSSYNTEEALGDRPLELVRPTNHVHEHNTIHHQILEVNLVVVLYYKWYNFIFFKFILVLTNYN